MGHIWLLRFVTCLLLPCSLSLVRVWLEGGVIVIIATSIVGCVTAETTGKKSSKSESAADMTDAKHF